MEFRLLGPVTVVEGDRQVRIRQRRQRALLALLLLDVGAPVAVDRLVEELWGSGAPRTAVASLQNAVSQLRRIVGNDILVTRTPGYAIEIDAARLDTTRFEHLLAEAQAARAIQDHATAALVLRDALSLWQGPALADLAYEPFAQAEIRRLEELRQTALEERIEADLALGRHEALVPELERLVADESLREHLHGQLMLALYRAGRQADALAAYRAVRATLVTELGIEPGPELRQLEQAILRQDASLSLPGSVPMPRAPRMQFRRLATILFADAAVASTFGEGLEPETLHRVLDAYAEAARSTIARHGGWVDSVSGDTVMATFGAQAADETHAHRGARAALELRSAVAATNERLAGLGARVDLRVGIATGEVVVSGRQGREQLVTGDAVRLAAGLQQAAAAGHVVVCPLARRLLEGATVEPLGEVEVRGRPAPVEAHRLLELPEAGPPEQRLEAPLVGRAGELRNLRTTLRDARKRRAASAALVLGPAGIGKSRLVRELVAGARGFDVLGARCPSYGEGLTYLPLRQLVGNDPAVIGAVLADDPDADEHARRLLAFDGTAADIARAFCTWCEGRAARRPLLLVVDDLHSAEASFLDLLGHVAEEGRGPIALVGLAREELLEERPDVLTGASRIELDGLTLADSETLVDQLPGAGALPAESRARAFEAAEGNPLFLEQLVAFAAEGESVGADRPLPATVQAVLAARLDRLGPGERAVLERAAVVGREFSAEQVILLLDAEAAPTVARHVATLERRGFVQAARAGGLRFRHVLVQEATYRAMPKSLRSDLHERLADALEREDSAPDAVIGYHLEQAYRLRVELAPPDRAAKRIAEDAGRRLGAAGLRAWHRFDAPAAANLLGRASALLPERDPGRLELLSELGEVYKWTSEFEQASEILCELEEVGRAANDTRAVARSRVQRAWIRFARGEIDTDEMLEQTSVAIPVLQAHGDERALGLAWRVVAAVHGPIRGHWALCTDAATRALEHYERTRFSPGPCLILLGTALKDGPEPVDPAVAQCERLVAAARSDPTVHAHMVVALAGLEAMRGNLDAARAHLAVTDAFVASHGGGPWQDRAMIMAAIEVDAGRPEEAVHVLEAAIAASSAHGEDAWIATLDAILADVRLEQGVVDAALELSTIAMKLAPGDDVVAQTGWRRARARALARTGRVAEAEVLARQALELLAGGDAVTEQAESLVCLAEVLQRGGRADEADEASAAACSLFAAKGNSNGLERARRRLAGLEPVATA